VLAASAVLTACKLSLVISSPANHSVSTSTQVTLTFSLTGNMEKATFSCQLDDQTPVPCESGKVYEGLEYGRHRLVVSAGADGDRTQQDVYFHVVNTQVPLKIVQPLDGQTVQDSPSWGVIVGIPFSLVSATGVYTLCQYDAAPAERCDYTIIGADASYQYIRLFHDFASGPHSVSVSAWHDTTQFSSDSVRFFIDDL